MAIVIVSFAVLLLAGLTIPQLLIGLAVMGAIGMAVNSWYWRADENGRGRHVLDEGDCLELGPPADCVFRNETASACTYAVAVLKNRG